MLRKVFEGCGKPGESLSFHIIGVLQPQGIWDYLPPERSAGFGPLLVS